MKKIMLFLILIAFVSMSTMAIAEDLENGAKENSKQKNEIKIIGPKKRVGVMTFNNNTKYDKELSSVAADILITELVKTNRFIVVERQQIDKLMQEEEHGMVGITDPDTATRLGKVLGLNAIVVGSISQLGVTASTSDYMLVKQKTLLAEAVVDIRVVDVETGRVLYADSGKGIEKNTETKMPKEQDRYRSDDKDERKVGYDEVLGRSALRNAITKVVDNVASNMDKTAWSCRIIHVKADKGEVFINAGKESGIQIGLILNMFHSGIEIKDPATGKIIGYDETPIGGMKVERYFGTDGAIGKILGDKLPSINDICRLAE